MAKHFLAAFMLNCTVAKTLGVNDFAAAFSIIEASGSKYGKELDATRSRIASLMRSYERQ